MPNRHLASAGKRPLETFDLVVLAYVFFSLLDCLTTAIALAGGFAYERNPVAAAIVSNHGVLGLYAVKFAVVALIVVALAKLPRTAATWVGIVFSVLCAFAVIENVHVILYR